VLGLAELEIQLLGEFLVSIKNRIIEESCWRNRRAKSIVKLLALTPQKRLHREQLKEYLWPDAYAETTDNRFRQTLFLARKILEPDHSSHFNYSRFENDQVELTAEGGLWVDVDAFEIQASTALKEKTLQAIQSALALYRGELLPEDRYEDWTAVKREKLHKRYVDLVIHLAGLYEAEGELRPALETLIELVAIEPALEEAHISIMRLYALTGARSRAIHQYHVLEKALRAELEVEPLESSQALYQDILSGRYSGK
jgi:DNA-binding SARP family transcriptional activator